ncbi:MAG TPA: beta-galactosidase [Polyangiaceae bacterium]|nr:beta-galactosidase [Polyangiaceae bacterium]
MPTRRRAPRPPAPTPALSTEGGARVLLHPHGLDLGDGEVLPLWAGAMHYWRHPRAEWRAGLEAMHAMGLRLVDTYVPWGVHERAPGEYDFGENDSRLDVAAFLETAHEVGLRCVLRPGPHINAELTFFGIPERVVWDPECQARTPGGHPVMLPIVPVAFPVPSYASDAFLEETTRWYRAVGKRLSHLRWPEGPIVLVQVDNEGALYFRDGAYDQDYHPDAIHAFRDFLRAKHRSLRTLREAWGDETITFGTVEPPRRFDAREVADLARHVDWSEFHEQLLSTAMERMAEALVDAGFDGLPTTHNLPLGESATPLNPARMTAIDLLGLDYYHHVTPAEHAMILRRTTELACRCEGLERPAFGAEVGAGFPPFFSPIDPRDSIYTLVCAMAYGLRGFNLYMAVERDRWIGAPIDPHGRPRPLADEYRKLLRAIEHTKLHTLHRRTPVRLVVPRALRRLARAMHAFGPVTPAFFNIIGAGWREAVLERDLGMGEPPVVAAEAYLRAFERALVARGVPFAYAGGETLEHSLHDAKWIVCTSGGGLKPHFVQSLRDAARAGTIVTMGPRAPLLDGAMRPLKRPADVTAFEIEPLDDLAQADALVAKRVDELALPAYPVDPVDVHVAVHEDDEGPRVVFVMNPTSADVAARVSLPGVEQLTDLLGDQRVERSAGAFELHVPARTVRLLGVA